MSALHVSIAAEPIAQIGSFEITNSMLTTFIVMMVLFLLTLQVQLAPTRNGIKQIPAMTEMVVGGFYKFFAQVLGSKVDKVFPLLFTFFIFILVGNWIALLPGVGPIVVGDIPVFRGPAADLNTTLALALVSVGVTQYLSIEALGIKDYVARFINFGNPIKFFVGILETISEFAKIISFSFRLFGNIFAGEVLLVVITFLVPFLIPIPFLGLEIFVGFIQALVFTMLTMIFIVVATEAHH